jgi:hypothetical protein
MENLEIKINSEKGRGVFTKKGFDLKEIIEVCPLIIIPKEQRKFIDKTILYNYYFLMENGSIAIALGYGSLYNHGKKANAKYIVDLDKNVLSIVGIRKTEANKEITINYNGRPKDKSPVWFEKTN